MRIIISYFVIFSIICFVNEGQAELKKGDRMTLLKIDKGEFCNADESDLEVSLSKDKPAENKKFCVKVSITKESKRPFIFILTYDSNLLKGKRGVWSGFDKLKIEYFSTSKNPIETELNIGDEIAYSRWSAKKQCVRKVTILPGHNILSVDIRSLERTFFPGEFLDMNNIRGCFLKSDNLTNEDWIFYIQDVYLEKE